MLVTKIDSVYEVMLPADVRRFLAYFRLGVSMGLNNTSSFLTCLGVGGFHWQLGLWMLVPPVCIGAILLGKSHTTHVGPHTGPHL